MFVKISAALRQAQGTLLFLWQVRQIFLDDLLRALRASVVHSHALLTLDHAVILNLFQDLHHITEAIIPTTQFHSLSSNRELRTHIRA